MQQLVLLVIALATLSAAFQPSSLRTTGAISRRLLNSQLQQTITDAKASKGWSPSSWKDYPVKQPPNYPDQKKVDEVIGKLSKCSPLVFAGEVRTLQEELAKASMGQGFVLMGGDCAEAFNEFSVNHIRDTFRVLLQMALVMTYGGGMPVTKIGRMAGQFAKPRSEPDEVRGSVTLPSYRGDIINGEEFTPESRIHDPERMLKAYYQSAQTLNIIRAFAMGGYADIARLHAWNLDFVENLPAGNRYRDFASKVDESLRFMKAIGIDTRSPTFSQTAFYTAHECLLLPYEQALTRQDSITDRWYDCSAHMVWIGERTRQLGHGHLHFVSGIGNPIGVKISDKAKPEELVSLLNVVNPDNIAGRVTVIVRMGAENIRSKLPALIRAVQRDGKNVVWCTDPLHANTIKTPSGLKTRPFEKIRDELRAFFDVHNEMGTHAGGVHLEMTGEDVTECIGGNVGEVLLGDLDKRYNTYCDPRLNGNQALELSFLIADRMRTNQGLQPLF